MKRTTFVSFFRCFPLWLLILVAMDSPAAVLFEHFTDGSQSDEKQLSSSKNHEGEGQSLRSLRDKTITDIVINGIESDDELKNARLFLSLSQIVDDKITQPFYASYLIKKGINEIEASQRPFGYYNVSVSNRVVSENDELTVIYDVVLGDPVHVSSASVTIVGEGKYDSDFEAFSDEALYAKGMVLVDEKYENFKDEIKKLALKKGYFDGKFVRSQILVDPKKNNARVTLIYDTGARYKYADVTFKNTQQGTDRDIFVETPNHLPLSTDFLQRYVKIKKGEAYSLSNATTLQQNLQASGYFRQVLIQTDTDKEKKAVSTKTLLTMNKKRSYLLGLGYSTDDGIDGKYNYDQRWVNNRGHSWYSHLYASQKKSNFDNMYRIPAEDPVNDYYYLRAGAEVESDTYDNKAVYGEGGYVWKSNKWMHKASLTQLYSKFTVGNDKNSVFVLYPTFRATYTSNNNRLNPKNGFQLQTEFRGAADGIGSGVSFFQTNVNMRYIHALTEKNRVTFRLNSGAVMTDNYHRLPPRFRYFTGGDRTIRGYSYQDIGPRDSSGDNVGGKYLLTGSIEYEYYFKPDWAIAVFTDAGDAFSDTFDAKYGAGIGVHWSSPVGAIRVDFAHGFDDDYGKTLKIHLSIGTQLDL